MIRFQIGRQRGQHPRKRVTLHVISRWARAVGAAVHRTAPLSGLSTTIIQIRRQRGQHPRKRVTIHVISRWALGIGVGGVSDGTTLWFVDRSVPDTAYAYNAATTDFGTSVVTGGTTYTTTGDADGYVIPSLTGISNNQSFVITIGPSGMVDIYPQC